REGGGAPRDGGPLRFGCSSGGRRWEPLDLRVETRIRLHQVRELVRERLVVLVHSVAQRDVVADQRASDDTQLDVGDVVGETTAVREARVVSAEHAEAARVLRRGCPEVEL